MKYTHESKELNTLLGKKVKVTLFDDTTITGILTRAEWKPTKQKSRTTREPGNEPEEIRARERGDQSEAGQGYRGAPL